MATSTNFSTNDPRVTMATWLLFLFLLAAPLTVPPGPGKSSLLLAAAAAKEDDFAEFDDSEFDYEVSDPDDEGS